MKIKLLLTFGIVALVCYGVVGLAGIYSLASCQTVVLPEGSTMSYRDCGDVNRGWFALILLLSPLVLAGTWMVWSALRGSSKQSVKWFMGVLSVASSLVGLLLVGVVLTAAQAAARSWLRPTNLDIMGRAAMRPQDYLYSFMFFGLMATVGAAILWFARKLWIQSKS